MNHRKAPRSGVFHRAGRKVYRYEQTNLINETNQTTLTYIEVGKVNSSNPSASPPLKIKFLLETDPRFHDHFPKMNRVHENRVCDLMVQ